MSTASSRGGWRRVQGCGHSSVWGLLRGPQFYAEIHAINGGWFVYCSIGEVLLDVTHLARGPGVGLWIRQCWEQHLAELTGHERAEYIALGLVDEAD